MLQHIFDPMLQRRAGGWATGARALHVETDHALTIASEHNVAAVTGHSGSNTGVKQLLDLVDDLPVGFVDVFFIEAGVVTLDHGPAGDEMVHDNAKHLWLQGLPRYLIILGDRDKVAAEEDAGDTGQGEERCGQRAADGADGRGEVGCREAHDVTSGKKFQRGGVGRAFGFDEHVCGLFCLNMANPDRDGPVSMRAYIGRNRWTDKRECGRSAGYSAALDTPTSLPEFA